MGIVLVLCSFGHCGRLPQRTVTPRATLDPRRATRAAGMPRRPAELRFSPKRHPQKMLRLVRLALEGDSPRAIADKCRLNERFVENAIARLKRTGHVTIPRGPKKGEGGRSLKYTAAELQSWITYVNNERGRDYPLPWREVAEENPTANGHCDESTVRRALKKGDTPRKSYKPTAKEIYDEVELTLRYELANEFKDLPPSYFLTNVFWLDEVKVKFLKGKDLSRNLAGKIKFVIRTKDEKYHKDCVKPVGPKQKVGGWNIMFLAIMFNGEMVVFEDMRPYKHLSESPGGDYDNTCFRACLKDVLPQLRAKAGGGILHGVMDNWRVHTAYVCKQFYREYGIRLKEICARSTPTACSSIDCLHSLRIG
jgi:hypothetical protein